MQPSFKIPTSKGKAVQSSSSKTQTIEAVKKEREIAQSTASQSKPFIHAVSCIDSNRQAITTFDFIETISDDFDEETLKIRPDEHEKWLNGAELPKEMPSILETAYQWLVDLRRGTPRSDLKKVKGVENTYKLRLNPISRIFIKRVEPTGEQTSASYILSYARKHLEASKEYKGMFA